VFTLPQERKETEALTLKSQLWNSEAELKQTRFRVSGRRISVVCDERS
jgi:hypothetical protein